MSDLHEAVFRWPYNANEVIVTGSFDQWTRSVRLNKGPTGFVATVRVPWEERVLYKFIVDGRWSTIDQAPTEVDWRGNVNNIYYAPTKPQDDTPRYEPPAAKEPKIAPVPAPVPVEEKKEVPAPAPQPTKERSVEVPAKPKDETPLVDKKDPSPPTEEKVTPSVPNVPPAPVVPVNDTKPVDTPPANTEKVVAPGNIPTTIQPAPPALKAPLFVVPVNDPSTVDKKPPVVEPPRHTEPPSTHALPVNSSRRASTGTSSSNTLPTEKKEEEEPKLEEPKPEKPKPVETKPVEPKPVETKPHSGTGNGTVGGELPRQLPSTPTKPKPTTPPPSTPTMLPSPPTTPRKPSFFRSRSSSPPSSPGDSLSRKGSYKKKRDSFINKVKHLFTPEKEKEHKGEKSHG